MTIPKIIHYCWFGPNPIPELELNCIETWKRYFPDYLFMFWNEETFDINAYSFTKQAYDNKYYAFVSDFVRAFALKQFGGIYLDTDVEILEDLSDIIKDSDVILGFENSSNIGTAFMAFVPNHYIITEFLNYYKNRSFLSAQGMVDITANPVVISEVLGKYGFVLNGKEQSHDGIHVYPRNYFFPKMIKEGVFNLTQETVAVHHFSGSWLTLRQKKRGRNILWIEVCRPVLRKSKDIIRKILGESHTKTLECKIRNLLK